MLRGKQHTESGPRSRGVELEPAVILRLTRVNAKYKNVKSMTGLYSGLYLCTDNGELCSSPEDVIS